VIRHPGAPRELNDASTKTGNARTMTLDPDTLNAIAELRREREPYGPWMFGVGPDLVPPDHIGWWWTRARKNSGIDMKWRLRDLRHWSATVCPGGSSWCDSSMAPSAPPTLSSSDRARNQSGRAANAEHRALASDGRAVTRL
jgi:integrase